MNQQIKQMDTDNTPTIFVAAVLAYALSIIRRLPTGWASWVYRFLSGIVGVIIFAPLVISTCAWAGNYYTFLGFLNPTANTAVVPFIYFISIFFSPSILTFLNKLFEIYLPNFFKRKIDAATHPPE